MLRITARFADAWFPAFIFTPKEYARCLHVVEAAASDAGRDPAALTTAILLPVMTGRTRDDVDEALASEVAKMYGLTGSAEMWACHGVEHPLGADFTGAQDIQPQTIDEQTALAYGEQVQPALLREMYVAGTPDEVVDQVAVWRDHGLRYPILINCGGVQKSLRKGMVASMPFAKVIRGLNRL